VPGVAALLASGVLPASLAACSTGDETLFAGDGAAVVAQAIRVESRSALPECGAGNQGSIYHARAEGQLYYCDGELYRSLDLDADPSWVISTGAASAASCPGGGYELKTGPDANGDGQLTNDEVSSSQTVCNGIDGEDGAPGTDGEDGADGADGKDGADGADGKDGADGADGEDGAPGADGADGQGCEVEDNGDGTKTVRCGEGGSVTIQDGADGQDGEDGEDAPPNRVRLSLVAEPSGPHCMYGGTRIDLLENGHATSCDYICTPAPAVVYGDLYIDDVEDLAQAAGITDVYGKLTISGALTSADLADGLLNLVSVDTLVVTDTYELTDLSALNFVHVYEGLTIKANYALTNFDALEGGVTSIAGDVNVSNNGSLTRLDGLNGLTELANLSIRDNASLATCEAERIQSSLESFVSVDIQGNDDTGLCL